MPRARSVECECTNRYTCGFCMDLAVSRNYADRTTPTPPAKRRTYLVREWAEALKEYKDAR